MAVDEVRRKRNNNNRMRGKAFEKRLADYLGFFRVPYSGTNDTFGWGDVRDKEDQQESRYLGECKSISPRTQKEVNYIIREDWFLGKNGILTKAKNAGNRIPFLAFTKAKSSYVYVAVLMADFKMLVEALELLVLVGIVTDNLDKDELAKTINLELNKRKGN